jgi:phage-related minor tail protein
MQKRWPGLSPRPPSGLLRWYPAWGFAYNWNQGRLQASAYNQAIASTGNISGQTADSLARITAQIVKNADAGKSAVAAAVAQATGLGLTVDQIRQVSETAILLSKNTGASVKDLVAELGKIPRTR